MLALSEVLLALVVALIAVQYFKLRWARSRFPPGPTPLPFIGNLWMLGFELRHQALMQLAKTYGNIFTLWLGQTPVVVLNGCDAIKDALVSHSEELSGRPTTPSFDEISKGKGIVFTSGNLWKQQRRFGLMTLRNLGLGKKGLESRIQEEAHCLVELFATKKGEPTDPAPEIVHSVANVIAVVVFGHRFFSNDKEFHHLLESVDFTTKYLGSMWARLFDAFPWLIRHFPGPQQDVYKHNGFLEAFVKKEIQIHRENGIPEKPQDVIDYYLNEISKVSNDASSVYDEHNMIRLVLDFLGAGTETTTTTLCWALLLMLSEPAIQEKVQKELDTVLGESQIIQYEDRKRLPYTNAVIHEIQRYSNIAPTAFAREVMKAVSLQGFNIEKGTSVIPNLASALFDSNYWETPHQFNPSHFLDKQGNFVTNEAFLPFSAGPRVCLGEQLARTELFIFFTNLLRAFTFRLPKGVNKVNMDYIFGATLQPYPYEICAVPRETKKD